MNKTRFFPVWAIPCITALILSGCLVSKEPDRITQNPQVSYEQYHASSDIQQQFERLTNDIFLSEVTGSTIDLHYSLKHPEMAGITEYPITFGNYSLEQMEKDTLKLEQIQEKISALDKNKLDPDSRLTYDILADFLETQLTAKGLDLYAQPLTPVIGLQAQLPVLLAEYTFHDRQDVDDYLDLLAQIDTYYGQIMDFERAKSAAGLFMSDISADHIITSCQSYLTAPEESFLQETFTERLQTLPDLTDQEKQAYQEQNLQLLKDHFIPAYELLIQGISSLKGTGTNEQGMCYYPEGKRYYEYLVNSATGTSYGSITELCNAIENTMKQDLMAIALLIKENPNLLNAVSDYAFSLTQPEEILESLKTQISADFPVLPECSHTVKYVPEALEDSLSPAFYLTPPMDDYEANTIYINGSDRYQNAELFPTLAHEGYPGHLYQTVYFTAACDNRLRQILPFSSYTEGWASYVEIYSYGLDNGLDPAVGKVLAHNYSAIVALHAFLDIKINYEGWTQEQMAAYLKQYYGIADSDSTRDLYYTLVETPTNYLEYYVGYLEIFNMRNEAEQRLGDRFNLKEFHTFLLDIGPAPFSVIREYFEVWLGEQ